MKVGILTYHDTANYGAALQAYATQYALTRLKVDAEIIDYTNEYRRGSYSFKKRFLTEIVHGRYLQAAKTLAGMPMILSRAKNFNAFYRSYLKMSDSIFRTMRALKENPPEYDVYLAGSDQIWNFRNNGGDLNYMLDFVSDKSRTVSYASSFGLEGIPDEFKKKYASPLSQICKLSVREKKGANLVNQITGRKPDVVLDPVFLPEKEHWHKLAKVVDDSKSPYLLLYTSKAGYLAEFQRTIGCDAGRYDIVHIGTDLSLTDIFRRQVRVRSTVGPERFLGYIKKAHLVLTSSFHGTAFSILLERPFIVFLSGDNGRDSRIVELLSALGLLDRIFSANMSRDIVMHEIDYRAVNKRIAALRKQSLNFLENALQQNCVDKIPA